jgi:hypothetical protein
VALTLNWIAIACFWSSISRRSWRLCCCEAVYILGGRGDVFLDFNSPLFISDDEQLGNNSLVCSRIVNSNNESWGGGGVRSFAFRAIKEQCCLSDMP